MTHVNTDLLGVISELGILSYGTFSLKFNTNRDAYTVNQGTA